MSGRIPPPLYGTLIFITMHSHQSYPNITTVLRRSRCVLIFFKYIVTSIVLLSIIVPSRHTRMGAWVNSKMYTSILYNFINCHARVFKGCKYKIFSWHLTRFPVLLEHRCDVRSGERFRRMSMYCIAHIALSTYKLECGIFNIWRSVGTPTSRTVGLRFNGSNYVVVKPEKPPKDLILRWTWRNRK